MSNAVTTMKSGAEIAAFIPRDTNDVRNLAVMIAQSGMAPKGMERPEKITVAIIAGMEAGLTPLDAVNSIAVINGRPSMWGDALLGLVMGSGLVLDFKEEVTGSGDNMEAVCTVHRKGLASPAVRTFSVEDAKRASLWKKAGPWTQYPKRMLQLRARAFALRDTFPDILRGIHSREEVMDYQDTQPKTTNPVTVKEIQGTPAQVQDAEPIEDAELVPDEVISSDEAQDLIKRITEASDEDTFCAIRDEASARLKDAPDSPLRTAVSKALKNKLAEFKAAREATKPQDDGFPGDLPEGQSMAQGA